MSFVRSAVLVGLGFWLGVTWADPPRGRALAVQVGKGLARAGQALVGLVERSAHAGERR